MKEVNDILSEAAIMLGRWALYSRFLASKTAVGCMLKVTIFNGILIMNSLLIQKWKTHLSRCRNS